MVTALWETGLQRAETGEEGGWVEGSGGARQQQLYLANGRSRKKKDVGAGVCYYRYITDVKDYPTGGKHTERNGLRLNSTRAKTKTTTFLEYQVLFLEGEAGGRRRGCDFCISTEQESEEWR